MDEGSKERKKSLPNSISKKENESGLGRDDRVQEAMEEEEFQQVREKY